jgi:hypothetical protein
MTKKKPPNHIDHDYSGWPPFLRTPAWRERMLADEREREREREQLERQRTAAGSGKIAERGNALRKIILDALAEVTRHIHRHIRKGARRLSRSFSTRPTRSWRHW